MSFAAGIYQHLLTDGAIDAIVAGRIYRRTHASEDVAEQRQPAIIFFQIGESDNSPELIPGSRWLTQWRVMCQSDNDVTCDEIADAVRARFHGYRGAMGDFTVQSSRQIDRRDDYD